MDIISPTNSKIKNIDSLKVFQKTKIMASGPITSWQIDEETVETVADFVFWLQSEQMVIAAMKLKDAIPWKENYDQPR